MNLEKEKAELREFIKDILDNHRTSVDFTFGENNNEFAISSYPDHTCVWAESGGLSIYTGDADIEAIMGRILDFNNGIVYCCDCGKPMPYEEVKGYKRAYFAGRYCQDCWDNKWKEIEANETYN